MMPHTTVSRYVTIAWRSPPCAFTGVRLPCAECNKHFRSHTCFANHKQITSNKKYICERKRYCSTCGALLSGMTRDCSKRYCHTCKQIRATVHLCYMWPLKDVLLANADSVLYIFYDFQSTQDKTYSETVYTKPRLRATVLREM